MMYLQIENEVSNIIVALTLNPFQNDRMKAYADDISNVVEIRIFLLGRVENIVGKAIFYRVIKS